MVRVMAGAMVRVRGGGEGKGRRGVGKGRGGKEKGVNGIVE